MHTLHRAKQNEKGEDRGRESDGERDRERLMERREKIEGESQMERETGRD